jgi:galactose oxidase-like protein/radical copper oxidase GlxA-like protein
MIRRKPPRRRRLRNAAVVATAVGALVAVNGPVVSTAATRAYTAYQHGSHDYKAAHGHWDTVDLPEGFRVDAVHSALLHNGKVLLIAGSGNDAQDFVAGSFRTVVWDPQTGEAKEVPTPEDLFCGGHAYLPDGNLLVAGGTRKYEVLAGDVTHAAGVLTVKNESDVSGINLPAGTRFTAHGHVYVSTEDVSVPPARGMVDGMWTAGTQDVWIEAQDEGAAPVITGGQQFQLEGLAPEQAQKLYGQGDSITLDKQNYRGLDASYEFDVASETYRKTDPLTMSRWYPTLIGLSDGKVLAVSGLDQHGQVVDGANEVYDPATRSWTDRPELARYFPTYPSLFRLADGQRLFYSGSNTGYGSDVEGRQPGIWDLEDNTWTDVDGLADPEFNETSTSFLLAPAQDQKVAIVGGGAVGDGEDSTARFNIVDLRATNPAYEMVADYPSAARYISAVTLPDDTTLLSGGSVGYRGNHQSDLHMTNSFDPHTGELSEMAPNEVGRNYHSTALLLPDGRVMTMGSDPLFSDADDTMPGTFEQRIEIYSPPYLFAGARPEITAAPTEISRGETFPVSASAGISQARLMRPSAVTHQTDTEQRSVALDVAPRERGYDLGLPQGEGLTPSGWYMLVVVDDDGVPSPAHWVHVA